MARQAAKPMKKPVQNIRTPSEQLGIMVRREAAALTNVGAKRSSEAVDRNRFGLQGEYT
jgi:hypothetical protein